MIRARRQGLTRNTSVIDDRPVLDLQSLGEGLDVARQVGIVIVLHRGHLRVRLGRLKKGAPIIECPEKRGIPFLSGPDTSET